MDKFKPRSTFVPAVFDPAISTFKRILLEQIEELESKQHKYKRNLGSSELKDIRQLAADPSLVLKPADEGGGIVIMNYEDYRTEYLRQLNQTEYYEILTSDPIKQNHKRESLSNILIRAKSPT